MNRANKQRLKKQVAGVVAILLVCIMILGAMAPLFISMF